MVRFVLKGGIWKNTEDEILKAAVMKYGKNQWARISSLLVHKTSKQCKARWYEWLDPSIRKTEWTREEDEKLLHLAKLMPTQWRTIAPLVGRTASQCLERYNRLLDAAQSKEGAEAAEDARKLRRGEVDPLPEAKPAKPDPVDMEEADKEMLSEARARLANTRGKKAKRKARERQLETARRLASMQKQRELKAAGISMHIHRRVDGIDYNAEIPFQRKAPAGFFEVPPEERTKKELALGAKIPKEMLEPPRREDIERKKRKEDEEKKRDREKKDLPAAMVAAARASEAAERMLKKAKLVMPEPQVTETVIEEVAKLGADAAQFEATSASAQGKPTSALMASYGGGMTPAPGTAAGAFGAAPGFRTPVARTPATRDALRLEAENLIRLSTAATPLQGGTNEPLHPSDFSGVAPRRDPVRTPNVFGAATSAAVSRVGATPIRDGLSINDQDAARAAAAPAMTAKEEKARRAAQRKEFEALLGSLPAPKFRYRVALPEEAKKETEEEEEEESREPEVVEDAADAAAREERAKQRAKDALLESCSQALRRGLPRVTNPDSCVTRVAAGAGGMADIEKMISEEFSRLVMFETRVFPEGSTSMASSVEAGNLIDVTPAKMKAASALIDAELETADTQEHSVVWDECASDLMYLPSGKRWVRRSKASTAERIEASKAEYAAARSKFDSESVKAAKLEKRVSVYHGGYQQRALALRRSIESAQAQLEQSETELACFSKLRDSERRAIRQRIGDMEAELRRQAAVEDALQARFALLQDTIEKLEKSK